MKKLMVVFLGVMFLSMNSQATENEQVVSTAMSDEATVAFTLAAPVPGNYYKCAKAKNICTGNCQKYDPTITCNNNCYYDYKICMGE